MSYCVNCGVKLAASEKQCPLCDTPVLNPKEPFVKTAERLYPKHADVINVLEERRSLAMIISIILALPAITCLVSNIIAYGYISWSFYVIGALFLCWVFIVPQYIFEKPKIILSVFMDVVVVIVYLFIIEYASGTKWFLSLGLPIVGIIFVQGVIIALLAKKNIIRGLGIVGAVSLATGIGAFGIEALVDYYARSAIQIHWSLFVLLSFASVSVPFFVLEHQVKIKSELQRRWHI